MPTIAEINALDRAAFSRVLGRLFEHSPWIAEATFERRPFRDASRLHEELAATVRQAPVGRQLALIRAHPDLAVRLAAAGELTAESAKEQAGAGLDRLSREESAEFDRRNRAYRERFGFPFVICARLNGPATAVISADGGAGGGFYGGGIGGGGGGGRIRIDCVYNGYLGAVSADGGPTAGGEAGAAGTIMRVFLAPAGSVFTFR